VAVFAVIVVVRLLGGGGPDMFIGGRLNLPLGYINGQGCVFAMGCWLTIALAERRHALIAGLGAGATVVLASLALMSQSRGAAIATAAAVVVTVAALPGRRRRLLALAAIVAGLAAAAAPVIHVYTRTGAGGTPTRHALHAAVVAILVAGLGTAVVWGLLVALADRFTEAAPGRARLGHRLATAAAVAVVALPLLAAAVKAGSIERTVRQQWHAFVHLSDAAAGSSAAGTQTRLLSGAGNRYDYWRIAWHTFTGHPAGGAGAGGYTVSYYRQRHTTEAIENPHSIELELLSELGIVGFALLAALVAAVAVAVSRWGRTARTSPTARALAVGATGAAVTWFVDTSGDWMHLLPGVTAIALLPVAVLLRPSVAETPAGARAVAGPPRRISVPRVAAAAAVGFVLALAGASLMRTGLSQMYLDSAKADLAHDPRGALTNANRALRLDGANLDSYYVKAAALARFDEGAAARAVLLQAAHEQPTSFVTWTLLGDLEVRLGDLGRARRYYRAAQRLDPHDPALASLVAEPASALRTGGSR
jgi:O-antigen ligase